METLTKNLHSVNLYNSFRCTNISSLQIYTHVYGHTHTAVCRKSLNRPYTPDKAYVYSDDTMSR